MVCSEQWYKYFLWGLIDSFWDIHENFSQCLFQLPEHLKTYCEIWSENCNEANSIQQNQTAYEQLIKLLMVCPGTVPHIPVQPHAALDQQVDSSWCLQVPVEVNTRQMGILLDNLGAQQTTLHFHYSEHALQPHTSKSKKVQCLKVARVAVL